MYTLDGDVRTGLQAAGMKYMIERELTFPFRDSSNKLKAYKKAEEERKIQSEYI
jgi:hypothetical protein